MDVFAFHVSQHLVRSAIRTAAHSLVLSFLFVGSIAIAADQTFNITYLNEAKNPSLAGSLVYGDVWAENGFAYVGTDITGGGMNVFSLANPANPVFLTKYAGDEFEDVEVWDGVGYFGSDTDSSGTGVDIVDLSIPAEPLLMNRLNGSDCNSIGCAHSKVHTLTVAKTADNRSFLYTTDNFYTDQVMITNVTSCASSATVCNPQIVAKVDMGVNPNFSSNLFSHEVTVRNDRMFVASKNNSNNSSDGWVSIYDVHEPTTPKFLKKFTSFTVNGVPTTFGRSHTAVASPDGKLLVVAEERPNGNVYIFDIQNINQENDPDTPVWKATLNRTNVGIDAHSPHHPHFHGNLLFIPWYEAGLQVFNITNPAAPVRVGSFDTFPGTSTSYNGDWGVDLSLGLRRVMLSDRTRGLIAVDASGVLATGDYDQNMVVNDLDYGAWRSTFGSGTSGLHTSAYADGNYNNVVDAADYVLWRKHKGETGPSHPGSGAGDGTVPEPTTAVLAAIAICVALAGRRSRTAS